MQYLRNGFDIFYDHFFVIGLIYSILNNNFCVKTQDCAWVQIINLLFTKLRTLINILSSYKKSLKWQVTYFRYFELVLDLQFLRQMRQTVIIKVLFVTNYSKYTKENKYSIKNFVFINFTNWTLGRGHFDPNWYLADKQCL